MFLFLTDVKYENLRNFKYCADVFVQNAIILEHSNEADFGFKPYTLLLHILMCVFSFDLPAETLS